MIASNRPKGGPGNALGQRFGGSGQLIGVPDEYQRGHRNRSHVGRLALTRPLVSRQREPVNALLT